MNLRLGIGAATFALALVAASEAEAARRLVFDGANRLASVQEGAREFRFEYDGRGHLAQTCRRDRPSASWTCTELVRDDRARWSTVVAAIGPSTRRFVSGPVAAQDDDGFWLEDPLRSPLARVTSAGAVTERRAFDAFGNARRPTGDGPGFGGEWTTAGVVDLRARQYAPTSGRFLQRDSWTFGANGPQGLHRYSYATNAPTVFRDPSGHFVDYAVDVVSAGISAAQCAGTWNDPCASNWGKFFDCGSAALDIAAGIVPFIPAVAGRAKDLARYGDEVAALSDDALRAGAGSVDGAFGGVTIRGDGSMIDCIPCSAAEAAARQNGGNPMSIDAQAMMPGMTPDRAKRGVDIEDAVEALVKAGYPAGSVRVENASQLGRLLDGLEPGSDVMIGGITRGGDRPTKHVIYGKTPTATSPGALVDAQLGIQGPAALGQFDPSQPFVVVPLTQQNYPGGAVPRMDLH
jgi:RHS repeat-associated protein